MDDYKYVSRDELVETVRPLLARIDELTVSRDELIEEIRELLDRIDELTARIPALEHAVDVLATAAEIR